MCNCSSGKQVLLLKGKLFLTKNYYIDANIFTETEDSIVNTLLFGKPNSGNSFYKVILNA